MKILYSHSCCLWSDKTFFLFLFWLWRKFPISFPRISLLCPCNDVCSSWLYTFEVLYWSVWPQESRRGHFLSEFRRTAPGQSVTFTAICGRGDVSIRLWQIHAKLSLALSDFEILKDVTRASLGEYVRMTLLEFTRALSYPEQLFKPRRGNKSGVSKTLSLEFLWDVTDGRHVSEDDVTEVASLELD